MGDLVTMHHNSASLTSNGHKCLPNSILVTATACTGPGHSESGEDSCLGYGNPAHSLPTALSSLPSAQSPRHQSAACQPVTAFNPGSCQPLKASPLTQLSPWQLESSGETSLKVFPRLSLLTSSSASGWPLLQYYRLVGTSTAMCCSCSSPPQCTNTPGFPKTKLDDITHLTAETKCPGCGWLGASVNVIFR